MGHSIPVRSFISGLALFLAVASPLDRAVAKEREQRGKRSPGSESREAGGRPDRKPLPAHDEQQSGGGWCEATRSDYDADGISDPVVYRPSTAEFWVLASSDGPLTFSWGDSASIPVRGDFDGDGVTDFGIVSGPTEPFMTWILVHSSTGVPVMFSWGVAGDQPIVADFDGDCVDEVAAYREGYWYGLDDDGVMMLVVAWGIPGDVPVPADYDGDGREDVAVYRPSDGNWWVLNSGFEWGFTSEPFQARQWGVPGDIPIPADRIDADGTADYTVWRPTDGNWYVLDGVTGDSHVVQWGLPGDVPIAADHDGDGTSDFSVFRPWSGQWLSLLSGGGQAMSEWGQPGDLLPVR